jgi:hypothetical protein
VEADDSPALQFLTVPRQRPTTPQARALTGHLIPSPSFAFSAVYVDVSQHNYIVLAILFEDWKYSPRIEVGLFF